MFRLLKFIVILLLRSNIKEILVIDDFDGAEAIYGRAMLLVNGLISF